MDDKSFRCPFEVKGQANGAIISLKLPEDRAERMDLMRSGFVRLHEEAGLMAFRCILPESFRTQCSSNQDLRRKILPYQCELHAVELEYRLDPFMPHQVLNLPDGEGEEIAKRRPTDLSVAKYLSKTITQSGAPLPFTVGEWAEWFAGFMGGSMDLGIPNPQMVFGDFIGSEIDEQGKLLTVSPGYVVFHAHRGKEGKSLANPQANRNCFHIVKSPFYPPSFGRYADRIEMVVSREADIAALSKETRQKIRRQANKVHKAHGIQVKSMTGDKQVTGVWVPEPAL